MAAQIFAGATTDTGRVRDHNEDVVRVSDPNAPQTAELGFLAAVADGMGGHERGEVASSIAIEALFGAFYAGPHEDGVGGTLKRAFTAANQQIAAQLRSADPNSSPGTTMVAAAIVGDQLTVANVGDSRAYLVRAEAATQITRDHSLIAEQVARGVMTADEAKESRYRNIVTRALGHRPKLDIDIFEIILLPDDRVVLCSDGVHGHVEPEEFAEIGLRAAPEAASRELAELALDRGSTDNVSAIVIQYEPTRAPVAPSDTERLPVGAGAGGRGLSPVLILLLLAVVIAVVAAVVYFTLLS